MKLRRFTLGRPQQVAGLLLLLMIAQCAWIIARHPLDATDYRFARCGRDMWERPSAIQGYFTTCGNLNGDGIFGYRLAGFPLSAQRALLLTVDHFRKPENRLYVEGGLAGSTWETRHELNYVKWLLRLPFVFFAVWLGGGLWWVARRLFGNEGGAIALSLYVFCPSVLKYATQPNNEILALWGLYGLLYTAIGVGHAMQGPRHKWKPRIVLLTVATGLTLAAHLLAGLVGFVAGIAFLFFVAERRRAYIPQIIIVTGFGSVLLLFAFFGFRISAFLYAFVGGAARFWFSVVPIRIFFRTPGNAGITVALAVALIVYLSERRSRYFGNTTPLILFLALVPLYTSQVVTAPWLWALPFLFTFIGGVFADALESKQRKVFLLLTFGVVVTQAALGVNSIGGWLH